VTPATRGERAQADQAGQSLVFVTVSNNASVLSRVMTRGGAVYRCPSVSHLCQRRLHRRDEGLRGMAGGGRGRDAARQQRTPPRVFPPVGTVLPGLSQGAVLPGGRHEPGRRGRVPCGKGGTRTRSWVLEERGGVWGTTRSARFDAPVRGLVSRCKHGNAASEGGPNSRGAPYYRLPCIPYKPKYCGRCVTSDAPGQGSDAPGAGSDRSFPG